jgi:hypothetical protein
MLTVLTGPTVTSGSTNPAFNSELNAGGPSLLFQGDGILDPRLVQRIGDQPGADYVYGFYSSAYVPIVDALPTGATATRIAAAQAVSGSTNLTLAASQTTGWATGIPLVPFGQSYTSANVVTVNALDFGFTTVNCTGANATVTIPAGTDKYFYVGQWLWLAGAGSSTSTGMATQVTGIPTTTTITVSPAPQTTNANTQCGTIDLYNKVGVWPYIVSNAGGGQIAVFDPAQAIARSWQTVSTNAGDTTQTITVTGYDVYGVLMHETATLNGTTVVWGKRAFKYITNVNVSATTAGNVSVGTSDVYGIHLISQFFEYTNIYWIGAFLTANTGWLAATDFLTTATGTSGDVRGTVQLGTSGGGTGYTTSPDGTKRLAIFMNVPPYNLLQSTNINSVRTFGAAQF